MSEDTGKIKFFDQEKGYGFVTSDSSGADAFLHITTCNNSDYKAPEQGQEVKFTFEMGDKGAKVTHIAPL